MAKLKISIALVDLDRQFASLRRRASRLRGMTNHGAGQYTAWTRVIDEAFGLPSRLTALSTSCIEDIAMRRADDAALLALHAQLWRARKKAARLKPKMRSNVGAWQVWSAAIDEVLALVGEISETPASGLIGVAAKLDAVIWLLNHDRAILDAVAQRRLTALGREVQSLASR
jgi:hypothetical protein